MKNKTLALRLLAKDCQVNGRYVVGEKTCAIGCLAIASGVSKARLRKCNELLIGCCEMEAVRERILNKFELHRFELCWIQQANDNEEVDIQARRRAVMAVVRGIKAL